MSGKRRSPKSKGTLSAIVSVLVFLLFVFVIYQASSGGESSPVSSVPSPTQETAASPGPSKALPTLGAMDMYIIDVGQGDSIFLRSPTGKTMLVDAGEAGEFETIDAFLKTLGVTKLDVVVATHPHSDHIGAMYKVIRAYEIGTFYMPDIAHTTSTFEKMLDALEEKDVSVKRAEASGETYLPWSNDVTVRILSPIEGNDADADDLNDWSVVLHISFGNSSILLTGDAEKAAEARILETYPEEVLRATVLKAGHHGSSTSSSDAFLDAVNPEIAVISCGEGNDYGHPHAETLERYASRGMEVYRTDLGGTLHLIFTAQGVSVETEK
ncbi:MAG TPA: ComEC/Rec2 family competence protein [Clostridia bacterium]|nr:ComEC/Rec2 family competence protein [Clostridia bacterium]